MLNTLLVAVDRHRAGDLPRLRSSASCGLSTNWLISRIGDGLYRDAPQRPAAAAARVLVRRRAGGPAEAEGQPQLLMRSSSTSRACTTPRPIARAFGAGMRRCPASSASRRRSIVARWAKRRQMRTGQQFPDPRRLRASSSACRCWSAWSSAIRSHGNSPAAGHLQLPRRHVVPAGGGGADPRPRQSIPRPSSPRSCAAASWPSATARPRRP